MASLYDSPLPIDASITPMTLPADYLRQGQVSRQGRADQMAQNIAALEDDILTIESRGVKEDEDLIRQAHKTFADQSLSYLSSLEGDYGSIDAKKVKDLSNKILSPLREEIKGLKYNAEVLKQRQALENKLKGTGRLLRFDDSVVKDPTITDQGIQLYDVGVEERLDWYGGMNDVFKAIGKNKLIEQYYNPEVHGDYTQYLKGLYRELQTAEEITFKDGKVFNKSLIDSQVVDPAIDTYIQTDERGNQQYRWYVKQFTDQIREERPDLDPEEVAARAEEFAFKRVKDDMFVVADKYRDRQGAMREIMQTVGRQAYPQGKGRSNSEAEPPEIGLEFSSAEERTTTRGSIGSRGELDAYLESYDDPYRPETYVYEDENFFSINSIPVASARLLEVGPDNPARFAKMEKHQFRNKGANTRGVLQKMDFDIGNSGVENRAVHTFYGRENLDGGYDRNQWRDYYRWMLNTYGEDDYRVKEAQAAMDENGDLVHNFQISPFEVRVNDDGTTELDINPYIKANADQFEDTINEAMNFKRDHWERIAPRLAHYDTIRHRRRIGYEMHNEALKKAGLNQEEFNALVGKGALEGTKGLLAEASDVYHKTILTELGSDVDLISQIISDDDLSPYGKAILEFSEGVATRGRQYLNNVGYTDAGVRTDQFWEEYFSKKGLNPDLDFKGMPISTVAAIAVENIKSRTGRLSTTAPRLLVTRAESIKRSDVISKAKDRRDEMLAEASPQMKTYLKAIEDMGKEYTYDAGIVPLAKIKTDNKEVYDKIKTLALEGASTTNQMLYKRNYNLDDDDAAYGDPNKQRSYTITEAITEAAALRGVDLEDDLEGKDIMELFSTKGIMDNIELYGISYDREDKLVVDLNIYGEGYEIRGLKGLEQYLAGRGMNIRRLEVMGKISDSLKANDMMGGTLGHGNETAEFFTVQTTQELPNGLTDNIETFTRGHFYIYDNGKKKGFKNAVELSDWYLENMPERRISLEKAATPLSLSEREFKVRYPDLDYHKYRRAYQKRMVEQMEQEMYTNPFALEALKYDPSEFIVTGSYSHNDPDQQKAAPYLRNYDDTETQQFSDEDTVEDENGRRVVQYKVIEPSPVIESSTEGKPIVVIPPLERAMEEVEDVFSDIDGMEPIVVNGSLRSITTQKMIYDRMAEVQRAQGVDNPCGYDCHKYSRHMQGMALDIKLTTAAGNYNPDVGEYHEGGQQFLNWINSEPGKDWMKKHNLYAIVHTVPGSNIHLHLGYNADLPRSPARDYLIKMETPEGDIVVGRND